MSFSSVSYVHWVFRVEFFLYLPVDLISGDCLLSLWFHMVWIILVFDVRIGCLVSSKIKLKLDTKKPITRLLMIIRTIILMNEKRKKHSANLWVRTIQIGNLTHSRLTHPVHFLSNKLRRESSDSCVLLLYPIYSIV